MKKIISSIIIIFLTIVVLSQGVLATDKNNISNAINKESVDNGILINVMSGNIKKNSCDFIVELKNNYEKDISDLNVDIEFDEDLISSDENRIFSTKLLPSKKVFKFTTSIEKKTNLMYVILMSVAIGLTLLLGVVIIIFRKKKGLVIVSTLIVFIICSNIIPSTIAKGAVVTKQSRYKGVVTMDDRDYKYVININYKIDL